MADLVPSDDDDIAAYDALYALFTRNQVSGNYVLGAASQAVVDFCGWHIAPSLTVTLELPVGLHGIIMLPSAYVTAVASVVLNGETLVEGTDFEWDQRGWVQLCRRYWTKATVTFTHGFADTPLSVKAVVLEVADNAAQFPSGNATDVASPGYRLAVEPGSSGVVLTQSHRERLSKYRAGLGVT